MKTILHRLYNGELYPAENSAPKEPEYRENFHKIDEEMENIKQKLSPEDITRLEKVDDYAAEMSNMEVFSAFKAGMKLGLLMTYELMSEN